MILRFNWTINKSCKLFLVMISKLRSVYNLYKFIYVNIIKNYVSIHLKLINWSCMSYEFLFIFFLFSKTFTKKICDFEWWPMSWHQLYIILGTVEFRFSDQFCTGLKKWRGHSNKKFSWKILFPQSFHNS